MLETPALLTVSQWGSAGFHLVPFAFQHLHETACDAQLYLNPKEAVSSA